MRKNPSTRWFFKDWEDDKALKACSLAAQGLWMRLLCLCAENGGYLKIRDQKPTLKSLSMRLGIEQKTVRKLLKELHENDVYSIDENGVIFNRRMARAHEPVDVTRNAPPRAHPHDAHPQHHAIPDSSLTLKYPSSFIAPKKEGKMNGSVRSAPSLAALNGRSLAALSPTEAASRHWRFLVSQGLHNDAAEYVQAVDTNTGLPPKHMFEIVERAIAKAGWNDQQEEMR